MPNKRETKTGLGSPEIKGSKGLFDVSESAVTKTPAKTTKAKPKEAPTENGDQKADRLVRTWTFSEETVDLLDQLKPLTRKKEGRSISYGELVDRAIYDLAVKMGIIKK